MKRKIRLISQQNTSDFDSELKIDLNKEIKNLSIMLKGAETMLQPDEEITQEIRDILTNISK